MVRDIERKADLAQGDAQVLLAGKKAKTQRRRRLLKRRNAIEPCIGHMKYDNRMHRNQLLGIQGNKINALGAAIGFNFRKLLKGILLTCLWWRFTYDPRALYRLRHKPMPV